MEITIALFQMLKMQVQMHMGSMVLGLEQKEDSMLHAGFQRIPLQKVPTKCLGTEMEQIAIEAEYFNLLPGGGWMPDFTGTFFVDSTGQVSLNHEVLTLNLAKMSYWENLGKSKNGVPGINMWIAGENFLIINDDALSISKPFFEKHLTSLFKA
jgi:hypothetical protein